MSGFQGCFREGVGFEGVFEVVDQEPVEQGEEVEQDLGAGWCGFGGIYEGVD